jgi:hypothetical protein
MPSFDLPDVFLKDFGVPVLHRGREARGILDMPTEVIAGGMVLTTDYALTVKTADLPGIGFNDEIRVDGVNYTVREVRQQDDGVFATVYLQKP